MKRNDLLTLLLILPISAISLAQNTNAPAGPANLPQPLAIPTAPQSNSTTPSPQPPANVPQSQTPVTSSNQLSIPPQPQSPSTQPLAVPSAPVANTPASPATNSSNPTAMVKSTTITK